jgi:RimJ/RimL family protein N-acetyltransferase/predicted enzyme related to lactoylglutathione lyase
VTTLPRLRGSGVVLRPWRADDAAELCDAMQDPEIVRWLGVEMPFTLADAAGFISGTETAWKQGSGAHFAVADPDDDEMIGYLGVLPVEEEAGVTEVTFWVRPDQRGRGIATDALLTAIPWIECELRPRRLEASMLAGNLRSQAVVEACGFVLGEVRKGTGRLGGRPADERVFVFHRPVRLQLGTVVLFVDDLGAVLPFYRDLLGFRVSRIDPGPGYHRCVDWAYLEAGPAGLELRDRAVHGGPASNGGSVVPAFEVADLDDTAERLRESGVEVEEIRRERWGSWTRLADPEGNPLELHAPDREWWERQGEQGGRTPRAP